MTFPLSAALLDSCVLALVEEGDTYGYILTQKMKETMELSESTLYPVLRRLQKDHCLTTYDQPYQGRNRRYYTITEDGRRQLAEYREAWKQYRVAVEGILFGGNINE